MVQRYAATQGWSLGGRNVILEGEHDASYFELAARLYYAKHHRWLLSPTFAVFPAGIGDNGGVDGIQHHFHPLRKMIELDVGYDQQPLFAVIALFDCDSAGKRGFDGLAARHLHYRKWRDIFLLKRCLPRETRDPDQLARHIEAANAQWHNLDCEIEDLLSVDLINVFLDENPGALREQAGVNGATHFEFNRPWKSKLVRFVNDYATLDDLASVVEALKSLRYYLRLEPDGDV